jgi:hypothetical protein
MRIRWRSEDGGCHADFTRKWLGATANDSLHATVVTYLARRGQIMLNACGEGDSHAIGRTQGHGMIDLPWVEAGMRACCNPSLSRR